METRAPFVVVGAFVLAAIAAVFGFVYWLHNTGGLGPRATYHVQFDGSVPGLLVGAAVLFNGIRVGEVTDLGLAPDSPRRVNATISVASTTPVRSDTKVGLEFQGLTGRSRDRAGRRHAAFEFRRGADADCRSRGGRGHDAGCPQRVAAGRFGAGREFGAAEEHHCQSAGFLGRAGAQHRQARRHRRRPRKDDWRRYAGAKDHLRSARPCEIRGRRPRRSRARLAIPEPTAVAMLETQRMLFSPPKDFPDFADFVWADAIPKLLQARLIESFENYDIAHAPLRTTDIGQADFQLLIDVRRFRIAMDSEPAARNRIVGANCRQGWKSHRVALVRGEREI